MQQINSATLNKKSVVKQNIERYADVVNTRVACRCVGVMDELRLNLGGLAANPYQEPLEMRRRSLRLNAKVAPAPRMGRGLGVLTIVCVSSVSVIEGLSTSKMARTSNGEVVGRTVEVVKESTKGGGLPAGLCVNSC